MRWPAPSSSTAGESQLDGTDITRWPEHRRATLIGRVFQNPFSGTAPTMTIAENLALAARRGQRRGLGWALGSTARQALRDRVRRLRLGLEDRLDNPIGSLSGGQRQALTLLMASWLKPRLLLLDEHTAALDPKSADQVIALSRDIVARDRLTTLMVTHSMQQAVDLGDRLIMMHRGDGAPRLLRRGEGAAAPPRSAGAVRERPARRTARRVRGRDAAAHVRVNAMARTFEIVLENKPAEIGRLVDRLEAFGMAAGLAPDVAFRLMLSLDEVVSNVIRHGFEDDGDHHITVRVETGNGRLTATVMDDGREFDPRQAPLPDLDAAMNARRVGGLGMHLVRSCMDTIEYRREHDRNLLVMTTPLASRPDDLG